MVSYAYLNEADFSKLSHCASSWKSMQKKYQGIGEQFEQQVVKRLKGTWHGEAATKAFGRMSTVSKQYEAAGTEAARMSKLISDAHGEFTAAQKQLRTFQEDVGTDHFKIHDTGAIEDVDSRWDSPTASAQPGFAEERRRKLEGHARRLKGILQHATQIDQGYAAALKADFNGEDDMGFNKSGYSSDDEARKAQEDADQAAKLIDKDGRLTGTELDQLDKLLAAHKGDPDFAARFAQKAGAENTLDKYNEIINPPQGTQLSDAQRKRIQSLQGNLGSTLGTATTVHSSEMDKFEQDLLKASDREYNANPTETPYGFSGYQLTSSLMSKGDWDDNLLQDYGEQLIAKEKQLGGGGMQNPDAIWGQNKTVGISGIPALDPMTGYMDALGHNPDASLEFLDGKTHTQNGESVDNLDYLMKDRHWPEGAGFTGDDKHPKGIYTLGHALESATTGAAYDYEGSTMPPHTPAQSHLVNELVTTLGDSENADLIDGDGRLAPIKGSLGDITANYMGDFQKAWSSEDLPTNGADVNLRPGEVNNFLASVGQDPEAYKSITAAQQAYSAAHVEDVIAHHDPHSATSLSDDISVAGSPGSNIAGILSEARAEAVHDKQIADADDFNATTQEVNKWVGRGAGIAIGTIASPAGGVAADWLYSDVSGAVMEHIQKDNTAEADFDARETWADSAKSHMDAVKANTTAAAREAGMSEADATALGNTAAKEANQTFAAGAQGAASRS
ncbi:hypothetical protein HCC61_25305 [Streptomyces sp. HNM0575]|uniref:DUF6571 family protein n=1 Tax=Streptomyces sp. HNM0575 TaxID=2716338 RepID=UPI00145E1D47|nr:DUF6571 family protein [Streptomyces sp. HNM0575]NLU75929.1 hypothetical protein [Streptomyces sp. HNM0575]